MGVDDFWGEALGDFLVSIEQEPLSNYAGKKLAVDLSIKFNQRQRTDIDKLSSTCNPAYKFPELFQNIIVEHEVLIGTGIKPVYMYDGMAPEVKEKKKERRRDLLKRAGNKYTTPRKISIDSVDSVEPVQVTAEQLKSPTDARIKYGNPNDFDQANILKWMNAQGLECCGSLLEADQQMVAL